MIAAYEVTFRTRRAAHKWRYEFNRTLPTPRTLMIRRDLNSKVFGRKATVFTLEIPDDLVQAARAFFPSPEICQ